MIEQKKAIGTVGYMGGVMSVPEPFTWAWSEMVAHATETLCQRDEYIHRIRAQVSLHDAARNQMCNDMRGDWLLMLDTDLEFEPDLCARLVRIMYTYNLDVVAGLYTFKNAPYIPELWIWNDKSGQYEQIGSWEFERPEEKPLPPVIQISVAGGGVLLIRRKVIDRIVHELPGYLPFDRQLSNRRDVRKGHMMGEDFAFFDRCRQLGIKAHVAWNVHAYHLRYQGADPNNRIDLPILNTFRVPSYDIIKSKEEAA